MDVKRKMKLTFAEVHCEERNIKRNQNGEIYRTPSKFCLRDSRPVFQVFKI